MNGKDNFPLTQNDLNLMMQSYENMILMHKTVLDQQTKTIDLLKEIVTKQDAISTKQMSSCNLLNGVGGKLDECSTKLSDSQIKLDGVGEKIKDKLESHNLDSVKEHGKIKNRIYVAYAGSGVIIIALISVIYKIWGGA
jgi:hypothetical protein